MASGRDQSERDGGHSVTDKKPAVFWRASVVLVFALAGALFWTARDTANGEGDIRQDRPSRLADLIRSQDGRNQGLTNQIAVAHGDLDALTRGQAGDIRVAAAQARVDTLAGPAGMTEAGGSAITVTLNDAPADFRPVPGAPTPQPDWLIIHQQDVQAVVNALWNGGGVAMQIMDQRIIATSAVRCVGNTLILQGRVYSPPYAITAIGDPAKLRAALAAAPAVQTYLEYVSAYGLGYTVDTRDRVTLPGYTGPLDVSYAAVAP